MGDKVIMEYFNGFDFFSKMMFDRYLNFSL